MKKKSDAILYIKRGPYATYTAHDIREVKLGEIKKWTKGKLGKKINNDLIFFYRETRLLDFAKVHKSLIGFVFYINANLCEGKGKRISAH